MENGFPGTLDVEVRYTLTNDDTWRVTVKGSVTAKRIQSDKSCLFQFNR